MTLIVKMWRIHLPLKEKYGNITNKFKHINLDTIHLLSALKGLIKP